LGLTWCGLGRFPEFDPVAFRVDEPTEAATGQFIDIIANLDAGVPHPGEEIVEADDPEIKHRIPGRRHGIVGFLPK